jgi:hypothetical protein
MHAGIVNMWSWEIQNDYTKITLHNFTSSNTILTQLIHQNKGMLGCMMQY